MSATRGTRTLLRFYLRRDRIMLACWIAGGFLLYYSQAASVDGLYTTQAELDKAAAGMETNTAFIAMSGPARALNTVGGQVAWQASAFGAILAGLMSMFLVVRHTRAEEETGRDELVRAAAIGRHAPLAATMLVVLIADVLLGGVVAAGLISYGLPSAGSISLGLALTLAGLVFGAVALVAAQLTEGARAAYGVTGAVVGVSYALRAIGDVGNSTLSWLSPIGWGQAMRAYAVEIWWPALLSVAATAVLVAGALQLFARRDVGAGMWPSRPGPLRGGTTMNSALGLAWRLQRGAVIGWTVALFLTGIAYGSIGDDVEDLLGDSEFSQDVFGAGGGSLVDSFYATSALMLGLIATGFTIASLLRLRGEEADDHAELLLATALPRSRWAASHLTIMVAGTVSAVVAAGLGLGLGFALVTGDSGSIPRLTGATVQYAVPVLVLAALAWLAYGIHSRWGSIGWVALGFCVIVMMFGELLRFPSWLTGLSPFGHLASVPAQDFRVLPVLLQLALIAALGAAGMFAVHRRDLA